MRHNGNVPPAAPSSTIEPRRMRAEDAATVARLIIAQQPVPPGLAAHLPSLLAGLIADETLIGACAEEIARDGHTRQIAAVGLSGFISDACVAEHLQAPTPFFALTLLDRTRRGEGQGVFLSYEEIARANAGGGLNLFPMFWLPVEGDFTSLRFRELMRLGQSTFLSDHKGYNLKRILKEGPAEHAEAFLGGGFRYHSTISAGAPMPCGQPSDHDRILFSITREQVQADIPGKAVDVLFETRPPRLGFTRNEQQVLAVAFEGSVTDTEISSRLGITCDAARDRWKSIIARVDKHAGFVLNHLSEGSDGRRGPTKRGYVINYLREHPEELRPHMP